ncbi:hypothetical protein EZV62_027632 [Acer yangbiense]|uniref:CCHC-type domain-containing protein n=1 Tax=Acer yangbiense TaxID=1000413 RepID=A0A5C7GUF1_9ROSI|nr:hypothetical protein EZV62_027632 [Acer yangbiense]
MYENLSIGDEDGVVHEMSEETSIDGTEDVDRCLVGKVLSGKKVNREAFKGLIEQIWNPYGQVEVELVGDNLFVFYFNKCEDRNRVWQRGPWHFGNNLIVLEKPIREGNISRRLAKWLTEQIGEVVKIPYESRECWGKYPRVKVRIDISKPQKRWLLLKLTTSDEVIMVVLKYERLPEFCYACGKIGHGMKECLDEEEMKVALEGSPLRFGSWLKAYISEKSRPRFQSSGNGSSSKKVRSSGTSHDTEGDGFISLRPGSLAAQKEVLDKQETTKKKMLAGTNQKTLTADGVIGPTTLEEMSVDGPRGGNIVLSVEQAQLGNEPTAGPSMELVVQPCIKPSTLKGPTRHNLEGLEAVEDLSPQPMQTEIPNPLPSPKKKSSKKWKRLVRESQQSMVAGRISSPLHKLLVVSKAIRRSPKRTEVLWKR